MTKTKYLILLLLATILSLLSQAQVTKTIFGNNISFTLPANSYIKDSSDSKITLRFTNDQYSKIEIKLTAHKEKDLTKYLALDKKKFLPDPHTRTVLPDANLGGKTYKKVKYFTKNPVLKVDSDLEYILLHKLRVPHNKMAIGRVEIIMTYGQANEAAMTKLSDALVVSFKY